MRDLVAGELVHVETVGDVRVITLDNPPVNALATNKGLVQQLYDAFAAGERDPAVRAFVLLGAGRNFCGGADISEFSAPYDPGKATVPDLAPFMDTLAKPIVVGIHGATMGGGLEVALACHYRLARPGAQIALPEVKLGVLPGAGGTQRIARLLGAERALDFVVGGDVVGTDDAKALGIVDEIVEGDLREACLAYARRLLAEGRGVRRASELPVALDRPAADVFAQARAKVATTWRGYPAPAALVDCIEAAATRPFADGIALEAKLFDVLVKTTESRALRHLFFAERRAGRVEGIAEGTPVAAIERAGIVGGGAAGAAIALNFLAAGIPVTVVDGAADALAGAREYVRRAHESAIAKGRLAAAEATVREGRLRASTSLADLADADCAMVAVADELAPTLDVLRELDRACPRAVLLAANTANLDIDAIAAATVRPQRVVGMHFFSPANVMRLVEVARGARTAPETVVCAMALARRLRKVAVCVRVAEGFIGNGMLHPYLREAELLVEEGASVAQVDAAARDFGMPMGPFEVADLIGLHVGWKRRRAQDATRAPTERYARLSDALYEQGRRGQKAGAGFYRYDPGHRTPQADGVVEAIADRFAASTGIARRAVAAEEIVERLMLQLVNQGARILGAGVAQRASDIDIVYAFGYGFPRFRGGPMFYADTLGLDRVLAATRRYEARSGEIWTPAPLLVEQAASGRGFND